jgi:hypothetical protein
MQTAVQTQRDADHFKSCVLLSTSSTSRHHTPNEVLPQQCCLHPPPPPAPPPPQQAAANAGVSMIPLGDGLSAPADVVVALQLELYGLHPKQLAWVMNVSVAWDTGRWAVAASAFHAPRQDGAGRRCGVRHARHAHPSLS